MKISEIVSLEQDNNSIILHKDGIFWRAYELSAYRFVTSIKEYNVLCKFYKNIKQDVVYMGFPISYMDTIAELCRVKGYSIEQRVNSIYVACHTDMVGYEDWKINIVQTETKSEIEDSRDMNKNEILSDIIAYPLATKTPMEAQQFLYDIQLRLHGII
tara:strand:- start:445 stop:918 length:474 start_codon:yes stop_codon:yes gene_type:complete